jgi:hypothetical protein
MRTGHPEIEQNQSRVAASGQRLLKFALACHFHQQSVRYESPHRKHQRRPEHRMVLGDDDRR